MKKIKQLATETVVYGVGNVVPRLMNFFLFPLHTQFFSPDEYGVYTYLMSFVALLNVLYGFGMETAYFRYANERSVSAAYVFRSAQTIVILFSILFSGSLFIFSGSISDILHVSDRPQLLVYIALILFIDNLVIIPFARLRQEKKPAWYALYRIVNVLLLVLLNIYFLYVDYDPKVNIEYIFLANVLANGVYLLVFAKQLIRWSPVFDRSIMSSMFFYAFPIMITGLAGMMNEFLSRAMLERWLPDNFYPGRSAAFAVGVFGACYKFSVLMSLGIQAFRLAAEPFFFSQGADSRSPALFAQVTHYFVIAGCFLMLVVGVNLDILKFIFLRQESYWEGIHIVPQLMLGYLFLGVYYNISIWFKLLNKTYYGTFITVGGAILTVLLNYWLIPRAGYEGSSWVPALVYGSMALACYGLGRRYWPVPYRVWRGLLYIGVTFLFIVWVDLITFSHQYVATSVHVLLCLGFALIVWWIEKINIFVGDK